VQKTMTEDSTARTRRRQAAILVAGYSRLLPGDEKQNFAELRSFLTPVIRPQIAEFGRNIFKETVELVLADFDNVIKAVHCAAGPRDQVAQATRPSPKKIALRSGSGSIPAKLLRNRATSLAVASTSRRG
jgi:hypothetical protein